MYVNGLVPLSSSLLDSRLLMMHIERKKKLVAQKGIKLSNQPTESSLALKLFPVPPPRASTKSHVLNNNNLVTHVILRHGDPSGPYYPYKL